ncbi:hypothetical protein GOODEAATRI_031027 [Goodea atripinnis]|uniref:Uncharacterized protein n=1 Tax=Goodea atripinnis TaxID=208336 RepID=A0ABV0PIH3_9TELE
MGQRFSSKGLPPPPQGETFDFMVKKYGPQSTECINKWVKEFYFPARGSYNLTVLQRVEEAIKEKEEKIEGQKKIDEKDNQAMKKYKACLKCWKDEAEQRQKKKPLN